MRYLGISYEFEQSKNMEILTVRSGTTFVKKTFDDSRERKLERERVCVSVFLSSKNDKGKKEKERKRGGKDRGSFRLSSRSHTVNPFVKSIYVDVKL